MLFNLKAHFQFQQLKITLYKNSINKTSQVQIKLVQQVIKLLIVFVDKCAYVKTDEAPLKSELTTVLKNIWD